MIEKSFAIIKNSNINNEVNENIHYWSEKTPEDRFSALEQLRKDFWGEDYAAKQRFPRFYKITKHV